MTAMESHEHYMTLALQQGKLAQLIARPNPAVGCVLVKSGQVVGAGYTQEAGGPHAEVMAIRAAGAHAHGATAYVTLEPCSHYGRTPPCSLGLIEAGIARLVFGCQDPNPQVAGQGLAQLAAAGIEVIGPILEHESRASNAGFLTRMANKKPLVTCKLAMSLDGRTAMESGESQWITGPEARAQVHLMRAQSCAVITGIGSILHDNPSMNARAEELALAGIDESTLGRFQQPLRMVVDSHLRLPSNAKLVEQTGPILVATCEADTTKHQELEAKGVEVLVCPADAEGKVDLNALLLELGGRQCNQVLLEAGASLSGAFLQAGLIDRLTVFMAPKLLGSSARALFQLPLDEMTQAFGLEIEGMTQVGQDWRIDAVPKHADS